MCACGFTAGCNAAKVNVQTYKTNTHTHTAPNVVCPVKIRFVRECIFSNFPDLWLNWNKVEHSVTCEKQKPNILIMWANFIDIHTFTVVNSSAGKTWTNTPRRPYRKLRLHIRTAKCRSGLRFIVTHTFLPQCATRRKKGLTKHTWTFRDTTHIPTRAAHIRLQPT